MPSPNPSSTVTFAPETTHPPPPPSRAPHPPNAEQKQRSGALVRVIRRAIADNNGWLGFDRYMHLALYTAKLGYYSAGAGQLGAAGDFITAPLLGRHFATCMARQCAEILANLPPTATKTIVEFGAGTGVMTGDLLTALADQNALPQQYWVVETSAALAQHQRANLPAEWHGLVRWVTQLSAPITGVLIANELLDALPVKRFVVEDDACVHELGVACGRDGFIWAASPEAMPAMQPNQWPASLAPGYTSELGLQAQAWVRSMATRLAAGAMCIVDYGFPAAAYYHPDRTGGTLMCHYRHTCHTDAFFYPGLQDITAHVDFSALARVGVASGLTLAGYCNQAAFLLALGLLDEYTRAHAALATATPDPAAQRATLMMAQQIKKLTLPHEMGELFKVIAFTRDCPLPLRGFSHQNHDTRL